MSNAVDNIIKKYIKQDVEVVISHACFICGKGNLKYKEDSFDKNYVYHKGNYYHTKCFYNKGKKR